jgi:hypothetical protein
MAASFSGGLIQEVDGRAGGAGGLLTKRSGCWWYVMARTRARAA